MLINESRNTHRAARERRVKEKQGAIYMTRDAIKSVGSRCLHIPHQKGHKRARLIMVFANARRYPVCIIYIYNCYCLAIRKHAYYTPISLDFPALSSSADDIQRLMVEILEKVRREFSL